LSGAEGHIGLKGGCPGQSPDADGEYNFALNEWNTVARYA
jgi:hypothetical protein